MNQKTDKQLVQETLNGDFDSFDRLVEKYQGMMCGLAYNWTRNLADAQDITQETFLRAYEKLDQLRDPDKFSGWLHRIATNACRKWQRGLSEQILSIDAPENQRLRNELPYGSMPEDRLEAEEKRQAFENILNRLSDKVRLATTLFYIDDLSYREISNFLGVSIPTVKSRLHKARKQLVKEAVPMIEDTLRQRKYKLKFQNLQMINDDFFKEAIQNYVAEYYAHFRKRLVSVYVWGSVHRNEAVPGVSDLQLHPFIRDSRNESDWRWLKETQERLAQGESPRVDSLCPPNTIDQILQGTQSDADRNSSLRSEAFGFRLRYDATLVWGCDLIDELDIPIPTPNKEWAHGYFQSVWELARYASGSEKENRTDFSLPGEPPLRLRKLARLGVFGGACLLMAKGEFRSFKGLEVIPVLEKSLANWTAFLDRTRELYISLSGDSEDEGSGYLSQLSTWMDWIGEQLE